MPKTKGTSYSRQARMIRNRQRPYPSVRAAATRLARNVAVNAAARLHPAAGLATAAGFRAYDAYRRVRPRRTTRPTQTPAPKRDRYITKGTYSGRVKATRKGIYDKFMKYNRTGIVAVNETIGSVTDADCVYIFNEAINSRDLIHMIVRAMVRKLFEKAGIRITGPADPVMAIDGGGSTVNFTVRLTTQNNVSGVQTHRDFTLLTGTTFTVLCDWFTNNYEQYCSGHGELSNANMDELLVLRLLKGVAGTIVANHDVRSELYFNETFIDILGESELKFQNRTKATGGSNDAEDINNNPLVGRSYLFKGVPKPKANGYNVAGTNGSMVYFERMTYNKGLATFGGNSPGQDLTMREPPMPQQFWNCYKSGKVRLEPGAIKKFYNRAYKSGNVLKILKAIRLQLDATAQFSTYSIFPVQMIALEDVINANAAENISVQYECQRKLGVKCWTKQKKFYKTEYSLTT